MARTRPSGLPRRQFFRTTGGLVAGALAAPLAWSEELPKVTDPRATAGDAVEPKWDEQLTIRVGNRGADFVGDNHRVIQAAVDCVARLGGGTVHILPGTYRMRNAVSLQSKVRILGSGDDSVLIKEPSVSCALVADADHYEQEIALDDPKGFQVGDGVRVVCKDPHSGRLNFAQRTLVASAGNRFKLDCPLRANFWLRGDPQVASIFPLLSGENVADITIENVTLDGNKANNELIDGGKYDDGSILLNECNRITIRQVSSHDFNCDGIVWGISHDVVVENCRLLDHARFALHPGSGSQRSLVRSNQLLRNRMGIYFCWGAKYGLYTKNVIEDSTTYGIHIGHRDTDNVILDNDIRRSGQTGVWLAGQDHKPFAPHRNRLEQNRIIDSGPDDGVAIDISGQTESIMLSKNELRETRQPLSRRGIRIGVQAGDIRCLDNQVEGFAIPIEDLRES